MDIVIPDHEMDRSLLDSEKTSWPLRRELSGIFNWAILGLTRLRKQEHFTVSQQLVQAKAEVRHENCSVTQFVSERCEGASSRSVTVKAFMHEYQCFCEAMGLKPLNVSQAGRILRKLIPGVEKKRLGARGCQQFHYDGIKMLVPRDA
jgi:putative DNA primase/helicase